MEVHIRYNPECFHSSFWGCLGKKWVALGATDQTSVYLNEKQIHGGYLLYQKEKKEEINSELI